MNMWRPIGAVLLLFVLALAIIYVVAPPVFMLIITVLAAILLCAGALWVFVYGKDLPTWARWSVLLVGLGLAVFLMYDTFAR